MLEMPPFRGAGLTVYRIVPVILASLTVWRIFIRSAFRRCNRRKAFFTTSNILTSFLPLLALRFSLSTVLIYSTFVEFSSDNPEKMQKKNTAHDFVGGEIQKISEKNPITLLIFAVIFGIIFNCLSFAYRIFAYLARCFLGIGIFIGSHAPAK